jgi:two-component system response regulator YesN
MFKVMIVDDEVWIIRGLKSEVDWQNYFMEVTAEAMDGKEAFRLVLEKKPDILITDIKMPGMDGLEFIGHVKQYLPETICIILSGYDEFDFARSALQLGVFDFLVKPIDETALENVLLRAAQTLFKKYGNKENVKKMSDVLLEKKNHSKVSEIADYIQDYYQKNITLSGIAEKFFINPSYLSDMFKRNMSMTFSQYLSGIRIGKAKQLLTYTDYSIEEIAAKTGFNDYRQMIRTFKQTERCTPSEYRGKEKRRKQ